MASLNATPAAPMITSVQCQTGGSNPAFQLIWQPQQGYSGPFSVVVTNSAGTAIAGNTSQSGPNGATWTATQAMNATSDSYYVQVEATGFTAVISDKVPLLFAPITAITTSFDGVMLLVGWTAPASVTPAGSTQILLFTPAGAQATESTVSGFGQMAVGPNLRGSGGDWEVYLTPQFGISSGPQSAAAPVYHVAPAIQGVRVLGTRAASGVLTNVNLAVDIMIAGANAEETPFVAVLKAGGATVSRSAPFTGSWRQGDGVSICSATVAFAYPMNLAAEFEVAAAQSSATAGTATGPVGVGSPLVLFAPQGVAATVSAQGANRFVEAVIAPLAGSFGAPNGSRIAVTGPGGFATVGDLAPGFRQTLLLGSPTVGGAYLLYAAEASGNSIGPWTGSASYPGDGTPGGQGLPLITSIAALTEIAVGDDGVASLSWSAITDAGLTGYQVSAVTGGAVTASAIFTGMSGSLAAVGTDVAFSVTGIAGASAGPTSVPAPAIAAAATQLAAAWTSTATQCVLSWHPPEGPAPSAYKLTIYNGATPVHEATPSAASYSVPAGVLTDASGFSFRVAATAAGPPKLSGPASTAAGIVSAAPDDLAVEYDGSTLRATWSPVPGATGYRAVLLLDGAESGAPWFTAGPATSVPLGFDAAKTYSLAVQATGAGATGPATTAPVFASGLYPRFAAGTAAALIPATSPSMAAHSIAIGLPQIFVTAPEPALLPSMPPFALSVGTSPFSYVLTIAGSADALPWTFTGDPVRADLYAAYNSFLRELDEASATALGIQTVQEGIARAMPQTFAETLLYSYGFTGATGYADLMPGMVLRVEYESYLTMGSATPNQAELNGFITSAVGEYSIVRSVGGATTFTGLDAFIARLVASGGTAVPQPVILNRKQAGAGGLIDSGYPLMQQSFLRLVYPRSFPSTTETGTPYPEFNAVLLAASKLSDLDAATDNVRKGSPAGGGIGVLYFRGRTTLVPQIRIIVDGAEQYAPLGTTVGDILAERAMEPSTVGVALTGIMLVRGIGAALVGSPPAYDVGGGAKVRLDWAPSAAAALLALPLLGGDRIRLGGPAA